jgi:hypothetical protein
LHHYVETEDLVNIATKVERQPKQRGAAKADSDCESDSDEHNVVLAEYGESLAARRALNVQAKEDSLEQPENIFHTRCLVNGKVCTMIIDGG